MITKMDEVIEVESSSDTRDDSEIKRRGRCYESGLKVWIGLILD